MTAPEVPNGTIVRSGAGGWAWFCEVQRYGRRGIKTTEELAAALKRHSDDAHMPGRSPMPILRRGGRMEEPQPTEIPRELGELAEELPLAYSHTVALLEIGRSLVAHRRNAGRLHMSKQDWEQLYKGVEPFLASGPAP